MRAALFAAVLAASSLTGACRPTPPATEVRHQGTARAGASTASVSPELVGLVVERVGATLREFGSPVDVEVDLAHELDGPEEHPQLRVDVYSAEIRSRVPDPDFPAFDVVVTRPPPAAGADREERAAFELLAERAARLLAARLGDGSDVAALVDADDASSRVFALHEIERRRLVGAHDAVVAALDSSRPREFVAACGALLAIGGESDADAIIAALPLRDAELVLAVLPALDRLGGPSVIGLLQTLASAHESPEVRQRARELLGAD